MTDQYQQNNINSPRKVQTFNSTGFADPQELDLDSDFVIVETATDVVRIVLPTADQIPAQEIVIKTLDSGTSGNVVGIFPQPGELINGLAGIFLTSDNESVILKASGNSTGAGFFWQVISSSGATAASAPSIDLLSTFPGDFSVDNQISFDSWISLLAALALLPTNGPLFQPSRIWVSNIADVGWTDASIGGASIEGISSTSPPSGRIALINQGVSISNVRSLKNLNVLYGLFPIAGVARFLAGDVASDEGYMVVENCQFSAAANGPPAASGIGMGGVLELHGQNFLDVSSVFVAPGNTLNVECYDRCVIAEEAFVGGGVVIADILDASANVSILHPGVTFDLQLGTNPSGEYSETFGNAGELQFGAEVDLSAGGPAELYAGGANVPVPPGSGAPGIVPPFGGPNVGAAITRPGYIRGIGVTIENPLAGVGTYDIEIYVAGILALTETGFDSTTSPYQFFDTAFARIGPLVPTYGTSLQVVLVPTGGAAAFTINVFPRFV